METKMEEWKKIFTSIQEERFNRDAKNFEIIIQRFLIPDNINPKSFYANVQFLDIGMIELYNGEYEPTPNIAEYGLITHRPPAYPLWFLAAYPDVTQWLAKEFNKNDKILIKATGLSEEYFNDESNYINKKFNHDVLRKLISYFQVSSGNRLETSKQEMKVEESISGKVFADIIPDDLKVYLLVKDAEELFDNLDFNGALRKFTEAIEIHPKENLYCKRGEVYLNMELYNNAMNDFNMALKINPNYSDAYVYRGAVKIVSIHDTKGALDDLKRAADLGNPRAIEKYNQLLKRG